MKPREDVPDAPELTVIDGGGEDAWLRQLADLIDGNPWKLADRLLEHYPLADYPDTPSTNNGLTAALRRDEDGLRRRYGIIATERQLRDVRSTAVAWPPPVRTGGTSFEVHRRIRGKDREAEMAKRLRQAAKENTALTQRNLARFRADENRKPLPPFEERMRRKIAGAVKRELLGGIITKRADWWNVHQVTDTDRAVAVRELNALANAIASGGSG